MRTYRQVTEFEPKIAELLARHAERLIAPTPPRGLWVCEENGEPIIALTVYTEPHVRVSAIIDKPETKPFASLTRLAETFETWATGIGLRSYCVVVDRGDDHYCKIIEKRGGLLVGQPTGQWAEYLHEIDQTPDTRDGIRPMRPSDWKALRALVRDALRSKTSLGASFLPTRKNIETIIRMGMRAATKGDPCLVLYDGGEVQGFALWMGMTGPFELRERVCSAIGLHARDERNRDRLHEAALTAAWNAGYTCVDAILRTSHEHALWKSTGASCPGLVARIDRPADALGRVA